MAWGHDRVPHRDRKKLDARRGASNKKNTKKWCRGVVGREHVPVCRDYMPFPVSGPAFNGWKVLACEKCGRHLDYYTPSRWSNRHSTKPEWVK